MEVSLDVLTAAYAGDVFSSLGRVAKQGCQVLRAEYAQYWTSITRRQVQTFSA